MLKPLLRIICCLFYFSACAQADKTLLSNWKTYPVPTNKDTLYRYNNGMKDWQVSDKNNTIEVTKWDYKKPNILPFDLEKSKVGTRMFGNRLVLQVNDGYLVGFNGGEFGASLYWFAKDGKSNYEVSGDQIDQYITRDGEIYAIQGLAHMGMSYGSIITINKVKGKWVTNDYLKLPSAPAAIVLDSDNNFIVITSRSLLKVDAKRNITTLVDKGFWEALLYPNSAIVKNGILYSGMRGGVYQYNLTTGEQAWLMDH